MFTGFGRRSGATAQAILAQGAMLAQARVCLTGLAPQFFFVATLAFDGTRRFGLAGADS